MSSVPSEAADVPSGRLWLTAEQLAIRYQISVRKIWYLADDGILPRFKCGHFTRFDPDECDLAMRAFRRASKFDQYIAEELAKGKATDLGRDEQGGDDGENGLQGLRRRSGPKSPKPTRGGDSGGESPEIRVKEAPKKPVRLKRRNQSSESQKIPLFQAGISIFGLKTAPNVELWNN